MNMNDTQLLEIARAAQRQTEENDARVASILARNQCTWNESEKNAIRAVIQEALKGTTC